jgi:hypothetical protein
VQGLQAFKDNAADAEQRKAILLRVGARLMQGCLALAFDHWATIVSEGSRAKAQLQKFLCKWTNMQISSAWREWRSNAAASRVDRELKIRTAVQRMMGLSLRGAFDMWAYAAHSSLVTLSCTVILYH